MFFFPVSFVPRDGRSTLGRPVALVRRHETEKRGGAGKGNWGAPAEDPSGWEMEAPVKGGWGDDDFGQKADQNGETNPCVEAAPT